MRDNQNKNGDLSHNPGFGGLKLKEIMEMEVLSHHIFNDPICDQSKNQIINYNAGNADGYSRRPTVLPASLKPMLSRRLRITTQDFFDILYWFEDK